MLSHEEKIKIATMFHKDHLSVHRIATETKCHHSTIKRVIREASSEKDRASTDHFCGRLEPYRDFITKKFEEYPDMKCSRLMCILKDKGVEVSATTLRRFTKEMRGKTRSRAFIRVKVLPGEQAQVDWGSFGTIVCGKAVRRLKLFVMVLSYSRAMYARFYSSEDSGALLSAHMRAFEYFGGVPDRILYDNMRTAVIARAGSAICFNEDLLSFALRVGFTPAACNPRSGWEKGRVERSIQYVRSSFFLDRKFLNLEDANAQLADWLSNTTNFRPWPQNTARIVKDVWQEDEKPILRAFKQGGETHYRRLGVSVGKTPYVRFDMNNYSVPARYVGKSLQVMASEDRVRIFSQDQEIAGHPRSYSRGEYIENKEHIDELLKERARARAEAHRSYIFRFLPQCEHFLRRACERKGGGGLSLGLMQNLAAEFGFEAVNSAISKLIKLEAESIDSLKHLLATGCKSSAPSLPAPDLSHRPELSKFKTTAQDLSSYNLLSHEDQGPEETL